MPANHYEILGVSQGANRDEIERAWKIRLQLLHPDRHQGAGPDVLAAALDETVKANAAWETLNDESRRAAYDQQLGIAGFARGDGAQGAAAGDRPPAAPRRPAATAAGFSRGLPPPMRLPQGNPNRPQQLGQWQITANAASVAAGLAEVWRALEPSFKRQKVLGSDPHRGWSQVWVGKSPLVQYLPLQVEVAESSEGGAVVSLSAWPHALAHSKWLPDVISTVSGFLAQLR